MTNESSDLTQIEVTRKGRVGIITLNRPERLNAWTYRMGGEMMRVLEQWNEDDGVGAVVVTGAGRGFCAGADIGGFNRAIEDRESSDGDGAKRSRAELRGEGNGGRARRRNSLAEFLRNDFRYTEQR